MPELEFSELPEDLRVKLSEQGQKEVWHRVAEFGGIKAVSEAFDFSQSSMYNWKNKQLALPLEFVRRLLGQNSTDYIEVLKGKGSSGSIKDPVFPLCVSSEFLTRVNCSVKVSSDGIPVYICRERSLLDRFADLLDGLGSVDYSIYSRNSRFELRYPKFLHQVLEKLVYDEELGALVDEIGEINDGKVLVSGREILVDDFDGKLYSRDKLFELALQSGDSESITELMAEESEKARRLM